MTGMERIYRIMKPLMCMAAVCAALSTGTRALCEPETEKPVEITVPEVRNIHEKAKKLADETMELRIVMKKLPQFQFLKNASEMLKEFDGIMATIAGTEAPSGARQYALHVAIGAKDLELALWYYMLGILEENNSNTEFADRLLEQGLNQLEIAEKLYNE